MHVELICVGGRWPSWTPRRVSVRSRLKEGKFPKVSREVGRKSGRDGVNRRRQPKKQDTEQVAIVGIHVVLGQAYLKYGFERVLMSTA